MTIKNTVVGEYYMFCPQKYRSRSSSLTYCFQLQASCAVFKTKNDRFALTISSGRVYQCTLQEESGTEDDIQLNAEIALEVYEGKAKLVNMPAIP